MNETEPLLSMVQQPCSDAVSGINMQAAQGELIVVIGGIGSGKSSLLLGLLGELHLTSGQMSVSAPVAYVEQQPVVFTDTIKNNVLFGRPYNEEFYT